MSLLLIDIAILPHIDMALANKVRDLHGVALDQPILP